MPRKRTVSQEALVEQAKNLLEEAGPRFKFEVVNAGIRRDGDWWYLPVVALSSGGKPLPHQFVVNLFANVEERLEKEFRSNVLFIPALQ